MNKGVTRRWLLRAAGVGTIAAATAGLSACGPDSEQSLDPEMQERKNEFDRLVELVNSDSVGYEKFAEEIPNEWGRVYFTGRWDWNGTNSGGTLWNTTPQIFNEQREYERPYVDPASFDIVQEVVQIDVRNLGDNRTIKTFMLKETVCAAIAMNWTMSNLNPEYFPGNEDTYFVDGLAVLTLPADLQRGIVIYPNKVDLMQWKWWIDKPNTKDEVDCPIISRINYLGSSGQLSVDAQNGIPEVMQNNWTDKSCEPF